MSPWPIQAALYARVSSEQQASAQTIASQVVALQERMTHDGCEAPPERQFLDEGYSGATLVRPALERLRDAVALGSIERLYVHSPDRLARKYAYQVLLIDEFQRAGVAVVFLNHAVGENPEDELLLQVQGMIAEYERAKILERSRRGKRHQAHAGVINVLGGAPYGYRYVSRWEGAGEARYELIPADARVVQQIFTWVGQARLSLGEVQRRLQAEGISSPSGKAVWDRTSIWGLLKNPAYCGRAAFGKTRVGAARPRLRAIRGKQAEPRRPQSVYDTPRDEWISIAVPAIVDEALYEDVQAQLEENRRHARASQRGARYLLQGIICCACCGYAFYGKPVSLCAGKGKRRDYAYYRCIGTDAYRFGGQRICSNPQVRTDRLELAVWAEVKALLEDPQRLLAEYQRRLEAAAGVKQCSTAEALRAQIQRLRQGRSRLLDSYTEGYIDKGEFVPRFESIKQRLASLEEQARQLENAAQQIAQLHLVIGRLEDFAAKVTKGLEVMEWPERRELIRSLVKRVEVGPEEVRVVFRVTPGPNGSGSDAEKGVFMQDCGGRDFTATVESVHAAFHPRMEDIGVCPSLVGANRQ